MSKASLISEIEKSLKCNSHRTRIEILNKPEPKALDDEEKGRPLLDKSQLEESVNAVRS